ncbi:hypothetical protein L226DRAFT_144299 [Lentinus tigrinus ALCF2SS1-7]|uniref:uncharacterized protein n=1 Tax=Lentinus tigrinus ALCF2SS1-7 TaxID=1328758 RepID=UPI0011663571|nr:hypothetical protein L226DRAFT_144299 [Lentinus tigrinus ALCF2SS1-7]
MGVLVSRLWKDAAGRTSFKFLNLPVELQVEVLCHLDPTSLLACRLTCRSLSKVFESMPVQYAYRLGISAMTDDGSPEGVSLQDRYSAILQFQHTWAGSAFSPRIQDPQEGLRYLAQSNGVFVYAVENSHTLALKLHRPGDARTGLPELTFMCVAWKSLLEPRDLSVASYTVDLSEDLLIITLPRDVEHHHHFLSISSDCYPHPLAASSVLRALRSTQAGHAIRHTKDIDYLEILSDLVAWGNLQATCNGDYWCDVWQVAMEVHVMNWKTGAVIWSGIKLAGYLPTTLSTGIVS